MAAGPQPDRSPPGGVLRAALLRRIPASSSHRTDLQSGPAAVAPAAVAVCVQQQQRGPPAEVSRMCDLMSGVREDFLPARRSLSWAEFVEVAALEPQVKEMVVFSSR